DRHAALAMTEGRSSGVFSFPASLRAQRGNPGPRFIDDGSPRFARDDESGSWIATACGLAVTEGFWAAR
ncbi:MAG: hypothetical protein ABIO73_18010, partial [Polaromonas sp.]